MSLTENNCTEDPAVPPGVAHNLGLRGLEPPRGNPRRNIFRK